MKWGLRAQNDTLGNLLPGPQISTLQPLQLQAASKFVLSIASEQMGTYVVYNKLQFTLIILTYRRFPHNKQFPENIPGC